MQSSARLEKVVECFSEMMLNETIKIPARYSEAYLSGRDLMPVLPIVNTPAQKPQTSSRQTAIPDSLECLMGAKPRPKPKVVQKRKESNKESESAVQQPIVDWSEYISKDVKLMSAGLPSYPYSDAYLINMTPKVLNMLMSQKFMSPLKNVSHSILRSGIDKVRNIEADAVSNEELRLSVRYAVGKVIKRKISKLDNVPEQLKRDVNIVFN